MNIEALKVEGRLLWRGLVRNIHAGLRLALFMPVSVMQFRVSAAHLFTLFALNLLLWFGADFLFAGAAGELNAPALTTFLAQIALVFITSTLVAGVLGRAELALQLPLMWTAADWFFELLFLVHALLFAAIDRDIPDELAWVLTVLLAIWPLLVLLRAVIVAVPRTRWRIAPALFLTLGLFWLLTSVIPRAELWRVGPDDTRRAATGIEQDAVFHRQPGLLAHALRRLGTSQTDAPELFFLGVAPYASQDVFLREMRSVARILEQRFAVADRSVLLINNPATLRTFPMASTTYLRAALARFGERMNTDKDILLLFITTHGERTHELAFDLPPLVLDPLRPAELAQMLDDSGITWRVIVVSACYSGGFVEALKNPHTIVITASDATSTSFGCAHENDWTYFGEAFFNEGMTRTPSFINAFGIALEWVARREQADRLAPSNPQLFVGGAIRDHIEALNK